MVELERPETGLAWKCIYIIYQPLIRMKNKIIKVATWIGGSVSVLFILLLIIVILALSDRTTHRNVEFRFGKMDQVMVGYSNNGKIIVHYPTFFRNDSILLKNIAGWDNNSPDRIFISPFMEISNGAPPLIKWAFPKWELIIDKVEIRKGKKFNSMSMRPLVKSQGYFYLSYIKDDLAYKKTIRIATSDQLPSCGIKKQD